MEFKTFFLIVKLLLNIIAPLTYFSISKEIIINKNNTITSFYLCNIIILLFTILYIFIRRRINYKTFIYKPYIPGFYLTLIVGLLDLISIGFMYYFIIELNNTINLYKIKIYIVGFIHFILSVIIHLLILNKKEREKKIISYTKHKYRLGIISRDMDGLMKGQPVEIIQDTKNGYIIKDNNDENFEILKDDLEDVINVV